MREWPDERCGILPLIGIIALMIMSLLTSCSRVQYVPVESVRIDSVTMYQYLRDSIYLQDSVYVKEKGDTIYINRYRYKYIDKVRTDTMYVIQVDSIRVPYPIEKRLNRWERVKQELGGIAMGVIIVTIAMIIVRYILRRFRNR